MRRENQKEKEKEEEKEKERFARRSCGTQRRRGERERSASPADTVRSSCFSSEDGSFSDGGESHKGYS